MEENHSSSKDKKSSAGIKIALAALIVIALCGTSFMAGMTFQKKQAKNTASDNLSQLQGGFGSGNGRRINGNLGTITAISSTSITVKNDQTDVASTYTINNATIFKNGTVTASISDIKVGDTVMVRTGSSGSTTATSVTVNPEMPSMRGGMGPRGNDDSNGNQDSI